MNQFFRNSLALGVVLANVVMPATAVAAGSFSDDFSDPASGWVNTQVVDHKANGIALYDSSGGYQMTPLDDATYGIVRAPKQVDGTDVRVAANVFLYTGVGQGTAGVVCRHQDNSNFYAFMVSGGHGYAILKVKDGNAEQLATGRFEGAMPNVADVQVSARCEGESLTLSLDGEEVASVSDADLSKGASGLIVIGEKTAGTSAVFDNFELGGS